MSASATAAIIAICIMATHVSSWRRRSARHVTMPHSPRTFASHLQLQLHNAAAYFWITKRLWMSSHFQRRCDIFISVLEQRQLSTISDVSIDVVSRWSSSVDSTTRVVLTTVSNLGNRPYSVSMSNKPRSFSWLPLILMFIGPYLRFPFW